MFRSFTRRFSTSRLYNHICETIGNTPIVRINRLGPNNINLYAKCEFFNPLSSVKDRMAVGLIDDAEKRGVLGKNSANNNLTVVEATSGNAGIALAMVCAQRGYQFVAVMAENFSVERRKIMRALGAKVVITPAKDKGYGMVLKSKELADKHGWFLASQFVNEANPNYHAETTACEILETFKSNNIDLDYWVSGYGSGGTFAGCGRVLKAAKPDLKIILAEPDSAPLVKSNIGQERDSITGLPLREHDAWTSHPIQGWVPSFLPKITEDGINRYNLINENERDSNIITITNEEANETALNLAKYEGIFTGVSGGATMSAALKVANNKIKENSYILAMLPDTMERYLSTSLFDNIKQDMNDEEIEISQSTPNYLMKNC